ncbi:MAG: BMP family ABC transporter substrate-binding protein [Gaiellaceae bacterium MAG52_C11]|nr:BMP family ABC transporter substrate-binding protein [Candidatus Gaiellasilicea maunaloa]
MSRQHGFLRLLLGLAVCLALLLAAGCGGEDESSSSGDTGSTESTDTDATGGGGDAKPFKVGLVTDIGGINDRGFNQFAYEGLKQARDELGVEIRVAQSDSNADYVPNLSSLARQGYDLVIAVGFLTGDATLQTAKQFPDTKFAIVDFGYAPEDELPNLQSLLFKEQQAGYLVGYLAGLVTAEKSDRTNPQLVIGSVGGQKIPPVDRYIAGFQKGAKDANAKVKTLNAYSQDFVDQGKCKEAALNQIEQGADVVFNVAGGCGLGVLTAAKDSNVWGIGVDSDQSFIGAQVLTSARKKVDVAVFEAVKSAEAGEFEKGTRTFELTNEGVGFGKVASSIPQEMVDKVEEQQQKIIDGEIEIPETVK